MAGQATEWGRGEILLYSLNFMKFWCTRTHTHSRTHSRYRYTVRKKRDRIYFSLLLQTKSLFQSMDLRKYFINRVKWVPLHHGMAGLRVADGDFVELRSCFISFAWNLIRYVTTFTTIIILHEQLIALRSYGTRSLTFPQNPTFGPSSQQRHNVFPQHSFY